MTFTEHNQNGVVYLTAPNITARHAFTTRYGGVSGGIWSSLNLGENRGDAPENVIENYRRVKEATGIPTDHMAFTRQVHGKIVRVVTEEDVHTLMTPVPYEADGVVTNLPGLAITCFIADCVPLLLHDPVHKVVGAVHCGWRSTVQDIMAEAVAQMQTLGTDPADLQAAIGASIGACCFENCCRMTTTASSARAKRRKNSMWTSGKPSAAGWCNWACGRRISWCLRNAPCAKQKNTGPTGPRTASAATRPP